MNLFRLLPVLLLPACTSIQTAQLSGKRDCLVRAIGFQDAYNADRRFDAFRWSKVLGIFWDDKRRIGHAVCVYQYTDKIMVQDSAQRRGGWTLTRDLSLRSEPKVLARLYAPGTPIEDAYYFDDL